MHQRQENLEITKDEYRTLMKNIKDEKFHELLGDYMLEISDPKNKDEYDEYLKQMEREGELPKVKIGYLPQGHATHPTGGRLLYKI